MASPLALAVNSHRRSGGDVDSIVSSWPACGRGTADCGWMTLAILAGMYHTQFVAQRYSRHGV